MNPEISVVIPVRNEALNVPALYEELTTTLEGFGRRYEIILIDDGSTDQTFELLAGLQARDHLQQGEIGGQLAHAVFLEAFREAKRGMSIRREASAP